MDIPKDEKLDLIMDDNKFEVPFQGRQELLEELMNAWKSKEYSMFGIFGMRSIGKSRLVRKHIDDVNKVIRKENCTFKDVKIINIEMKIIKTIKQLHDKMCAILGISPDLGYNEETNAWFSQITSHIKQLSDHFFIVLFDNCEDVYDINSEIKDVFLQFLVTLSINRCNCTVYITSTMQILFVQKETTYFFKTLEPMNKLESKNLLRAVTRNLNVNEHLDKIVELCGGLPLAIMMVGSELTVDEGMLKPEYMVELLTECRLRALSREYYPKEQRIADVYKDFILRLSAIFQQRLATLGYIPGSFTAIHVKEMLDQKTVALAEDLILIPMKRGNYISYDSKTERFDIHGILRDCLSVYVCIKNIPAVRKKYCKIFAEELKKMSHLMSTADYAEALDLFRQENLNFQKLLTEIICTPQDNYHFLIEVASSCYPLLETFMVSHCETFYQGCLKIAGEYGRNEDVAIVKISFGSLLTNAKDDTIGGEEYYRQALHVLKAGPSCKTLAEVHQRLGWNLYVQGRAVESLRHLKNSLDISHSLGNDRTVLCLQSLNSLGLVCTFVGNFDAAEKYQQESIRRYRKNLEEENVQRVKQNKRPICEEELPNFGSLFDNMGSLYQQRGDNDKALYYHKKGLDIKCKIKVPTKTLLISMNNVACGYSLLGRHQEAIQLLKEAEAMVLKEIPLHEPNLGTVHDTMGKVYLNCNEFCKAKTYLETAVTTQKTYMARNPLHAESVMRLSQAELGLKNYETARQLAAEVLSMKNDIIKSMPQNSSVSEALQCLVELDLQFNNENIEWLSETYLELKEELKRLINIYENKYNEKMVRHFKDRLEAIERKVNESRYN